MKMLKCICVICICLMSILITFCTKKRNEWPKGAEVGFIDVDGGKVYFHLYGKDKKGIPLVMLHGGPGSYDEKFFNQIELSDERPVLLFNQLGSVGSDVSDEYDSPDKVKELFTVEHFADEVDEVIKHFGFNEFILYGHSWGTMLSIEYVNMHKPSGLKGIVLSGVFLNTDRWINDAERLMKKLPDGEKMWQKVKECEEKGVYDDEFNKILDTYTKNYYNRKENMTINMPTTLSQKKVCGIDPYNYMWGMSEFSCTGTLNHHDSTKYLKDINVPILYIVGEYDTGTPEAAAYYNSLTKNGEIYVLKDCGHNSYMQSPQEYNGVLRKFFDKIESN